MLARRCEPSLLLQVRVKVNGVLMDFHLELGQYGSAFFAHTRDEVISDGEDNVEGAPLLPAHLLQAGHAPHHPLCHPLFSTSCCPWSPTLCEPILNHLADAVCSPEGPSELETCLSLTHLKVACGQTFIQWPETVGHSSKTTGHLPL